MALRSSIVVVDPFAVGVPLSLLLGSALPLLLVLPVSPSTSTPVILISSTNSCAASTTSATFSTAVSNACSALVASDDVEGSGSSVCIGSGASVTSTSGCGSGLAAFLPFLLVRFELRWAGMMDEERSGDRWRVWDGSGLGQTVTCVQFYYAPS